VTVVIDPRPRWDKETMLEAHQRSLQAIVELHRVTLNWLHDDDCDCDADDDADDADDADDEGAAS